MRKIDKKNKISFNVFGILIVAFLAVFAVTGINVLKKGEQEYHVAMGSVVYDESMSRVDMASSGTAKKKWNGKYYLSLENGGNYCLGAHNVMYDTGNRELSIIGETHQVFTDGSIRNLSGKTVVENKNEVSFFKLDDRNYLMSAPDIKGEEQGFEAKDYVQINLDKSGNALLTNGDVNMKTVDPMVLRSGDVEFDIANELLIYKDQKVDLKAINGSTNEYVPPEEPDIETEEEAEEDTEDEDGSDADNTAGGSVVNNTSSNNNTNNNDVTNNSQDVVVNGAGDAVNGNGTGTNNGNGSGSGTNNEPGPGTNNEPGTGNNETEDGDGSGTGNNNEPDGGENNNTENGDGDNTTGGTNNGNGTGTGNNGTGNNGTGNNGTGTGNSNQPGNLDRAAALRGTVSDVTSITVNYYIMDPENKYVSTYLLVSEDGAGEVQRIELSKADTSMTVRGLKPNTQYRIALGYDMYVVIEGESELSENTEDVVKARTKAIKSSVKINKITADKIHFTVELDKSHLLDAANICLYGDGETRAAQMPIDVKKASGGGFSGSFLIEDAFPGESPSQYVLAVEDANYQGEPVTLNAKCITKNSGITRFIDSLLRGFN